ncbi:MAG: hypothetical protein JRG96_00870 [Deltaproteobacteria bacterium]|nr:hypothetical protein [Deltaproteobacteria bacterium]
MRAYRKFAGTRAGRVFSVVQCLLLLLATSCIPIGYEGRGDGQPAAGRPEFQRSMVVELPGSTTVNMAGGNLMVDRVDLTIDTRLGTQVYGAAYNSTGNEWIWSFDLRYDGERFIDATGARYFIDGLSPGAMIPGSDWVRVDADTLRRIDGMLFHFENGKVARIHRASSQYPQLFYRYRIMGGEGYVDRISDCTRSYICDEVVALHWAFLPGSGVQLQVIADRSGREAHFKYRQGRIVSARDPLDLEQLWPGYRYEYAGEGGRLSAVVDSEEARIEYSYAFGRIQELRQIGAQNPVHRFEFGWDAERAMWYGASLGPGGQLCVRRYESFGRLRELSCDPDEFVAMSWDRDLRPSSRYHNGLTTSWSYPDANTVVETRPSGNRVTTVYSPTGVDRRGRRPVASVRDSLGLIEHRGYNPAGRLRAIDNGEGDRLWFQYDSDEHISALIRNSTVVEEAPSVSIYFDDFHVSGQPQYVFHPDQMGELRSYDAVGNQLTGSNLARAVDPGRPGIVSRAFDGDRNLRELRVKGIASEGTQGPQEVIRIDYRSDHQVSQISRPFGGDSRFEYDELGRRVARYDVVDGVERPARMTYDASGNLRSMEQANGMRVELDYDSLDRVSEQRWLRQGVVSKILWIGRSDGRVSELRDSTHAYQPETIQYDQAGRIARVDFPMGLASRQLEYDLRNRVIATHYLQDDLGVRSLEYAYDLADRRVGVWDDGERAWEKTFEGGRLARQDYGTTGYSSVSYELTGEALGWVGYTEARNFMGARVVRIDYDRNPCNTSIWNLCTDVFVEVMGVHAAVAHESYAVGQVTGAAGRRVLASLGGDLTVGSVPQAGDPGAGSHFDYDALNNIERIATLPDGPEISFVYNAERNRLLETREANSGDIIHAYAYDESGYVTSRDGVPIGYDDAGLTVSIGNDVSFEWDALGRPVSSNVEGQQRHYYFGGDVLGDAVGNLFAIESDEFTIDLTQGTHRFRHYDFRNNVRFVTDDQGEVVQHFVYGPYGVVEEFGSGQGQSFARGQGIGSTGLTLLGVRVLDSDIGRFISPDPILQLGDSHGYAGGNPLDLWDPDGRHATGAEFGGGVSRFEIGTLLILTGAALATGAGVLAGLGYAAAATALGITSTGFVFTGWAVAASEIVGAAPAPPSSPGGGPYQAPDVGATLEATTFGCSPTHPSTVPVLPAAIWLLAPLQILLGCLLVSRHRRARRREDGRGWE